MTECVFLNDPAAASISATVVASGPDGIVLDRTVFYARGGGQPGDTGQLRWEGGETAIIDTLKGDSGAILHQPAADAVPPPAGTRVEAAIDWQRRHALMRMHTAMHLLCSLIKGAAVTGGSVGVEKSRLDFDLPVSPKKEDIETQLNALITADHPVRIEWVDESVLDAEPGLVRTMSVKPPRGSGRLRLIRIGDGNEPLDLQPCGGTHIARTGEIGPMRVVKIENKGKQNRRIIIAPAAARRCPWTIRRPEHLVMQLGLPETLPTYGGTLVISMGATTMSIADVLRSKGNRVVKVTTSDTVISAIAKLAEHRIGAVVVEDQWMRPVGIFSERDFVNSIAEFGAQVLTFPVDRLMSAPIVTCQSTDAVETALGAMTLAKIRHLPVIDAGNLVGIVSIGDLVKHRLDEKALEANVLLDIARLHA